MQFLRGEFEYSIRTYVQGCIKLVVSLQTTCARQPHIERTRERGRESARERERERERACEGEKIGRGRGESERETLVFARWTRACASVLTLTGRRQAGILPTPPPPTIPEPCLFRTPLLAIIFHIKSPPPAPLPPAPLPPAPLPPTFHSVFACCLSPYLDPLHPLHPEPQLPLPFQANRLSRSRGRRYILPSVPRPAPATPSSPACRHGTRSLA
jgi:hypothetical protein